MTQGFVVAYSCARLDNPQSHESVTRTEIAKRLAALKGYEFAGEYDASARYSGPVYFVPSETIIGIETAYELGIRTEQDLFGGVVPYPFVATKTISHPLVDSDSYAPQGWSPDFGRRVHDTVLAGFAAFTLPDARRAGAHLLERGPVRIKQAWGIGGLGQAVVSEAAELDAVLDTIDVDELSQYGLALEENLTDVTTYSVGQVCVAEFLTTYCGTQRLTTDNNGTTVYGGSDLLIARGDFATLLELDLTPGARLAIAQARTYDTAAIESFPGLFASRRNYDVAQGFDIEGRQRSGVLEQSWRIGGASGAEIVALEAFCADPELLSVRAWCTEIYGAPETTPAHAFVYFRGIDERVGPITKYAMVEPYGNAR
jgi:hypothetical protein